MANAWPMIERCKLAQWRAQTLTEEEWDHYWRMDFAGLVDDESYEREILLWSENGLKLLSLKESRFNIKESRSSQTESKRS